MPEQLRFDQLVGKGGAVQCAKPPVTARTEPMNRPRDEFLAATALALDQDRKRRARRAGDRLAQRAGLRALAEEILPGWSRARRRRSIERRLYACRKSQCSNAHQRTRARGINRCPSGPACSDRTDDLAAIADRFGRLAWLFGHVDGNSNRRSGGAPGDMWLARPGASVHTQHPPICRGRRDDDRGCAKFVVQGFGDAIDRRAIVVRRMSQVEEGLEVCDRICIRWHDRASDHHGTAGNDERLGCGIEVEAIEPGKYTASEGLEQRRISAGDDARDQAACVLAMDATSNIRFCQAYACGHQWQTGDPCCLQSAVDVRSRGAIIAGRRNGCGIRPGRDRVDSQVGLFLGLFNSHTRRTHGRRNQSLGEQDS